MKKLMFLFVSLLTLTMTSCGDDDEDIIVDVYNGITYISKEMVSSEGGTVDVVWHDGIDITDNVYTAPWEYGPGNIPIFPTKLEEWEKVNTTIEKDVLTGDGIVIAPVGSKVYGIYSGVRITLSPNTTGKKRCYRIFGEIRQSPAYICQDCEETEE